MTSSGLRRRCEILRSLHRAGAPLLLPNAWDAATARSVAAAGFPVVATTSAGVAAALGFEDHEGAAAAPMLAAAAAIAAAVDVPVSVDAEAGYGLEPGDLVAALAEAGVAGCNLEDSDHAAGGRRDPAAQAEYLRGVRAAAEERGYPLVVNARIDDFLDDFIAGSQRPQAELLDGARARARAYLEAGADCVFPIALWERQPLADFIDAAAGPVNVLMTPRTPALAELAELGAARVSWGPFLFREALADFNAKLASIAAGAPGG